MSDSYQAIHDAVRSRIGSCQPSDVLREATASWDISMSVHMVQSAFQEAAWAAASPSAIYRPALSIDGNQWCAVYGANLMEGVAGFGGSPALAMADFDKNWNAALKTTGAAIHAQAGGSES